MIPAGRLEQRGDSRLHAARADALQSLVHQDAVVAVERHDVGDGAQRDEGQQLGEVRHAAFRGRGTRRLNQPRCRSSARSASIR